MKPSASAFSGTSRVPVLSPELEATLQGRRIVRKHRRATLADRDLRHHRKLDRALVEVARHVHILSRMRWKKSVAETYLAEFARGRPRLPEVRLHRIDYRDEVRELLRIEREASRSSPLGRFLRRTARSYRWAARMMMSQGTPAFTELSARLYGHPADPMGWDDVSQLGAAEHFISANETFVAGYTPPAKEFCLTPRYAAAQFRRTLVGFFRDHEVRVTLDPRLASKAAASRNRVRVRKGTCFSSDDIAQLIEHEGFVHLLTLINGCEQPNLRSLGLPSPRTTRTQEGLATFAELMTGTMDLARLNRIALRTKALAYAMDGANFNDVFYFFHASGAEPLEAFHSARRIFRGGDVRGRIAFTKDLVYLQGLFFVHTFFRKAMQENKFEYAYRLFAGRMTLGDVVDMEPCFASGLIVPAYYKPAWLTRRERLAAQLSYLVFINQMPLTDVSLRDFVRHDKGESSHGH